MAHPQPPRTRRLVWHAALTAFLVLSAGVLFVMPFGQPEDEPAPGDDPAGDRAARAEPQEPQPGPGGDPEELAEQLALKKRGDWRGAYEQLLAIGEPATAALSAYSRQYPDDVNLSRESPQRWRAGRRAERLVRLIEERQAERRFGEELEESALDRFVAVVGLEAQAGRAVYREALYPNEGLMAVADEAAQVDWATLGEAERAELRRRFNEAWSPVAERWRDGVHLDAFVYRTGKREQWPMSPPVVGDLIALFYARSQTPDDWTVPWLSGQARRTLSEEILAESQVARLEQTLREQTDLSRALHALLKASAEQAGPGNSRNAMLEIALANRLKPMARQLSRQVVAEELAAFREAAGQATDPAEGEPIGELVETGPRMKVKTDATLEPGEYLVALRDGRFIGWLRVNRDAESAHWQTAYVVERPQSGDVAARPPAGAMTPPARARAARARFLAAHALASYGQGLEDAQALLALLDPLPGVGGQAQEQEIRKYGTEEGFAVRDYAMMGLLRVSDQTADQFDDVRPVRGYCPFAAAVKLLDFGEGERWQAARETMETWVARQTGP